VKPAPEIPSVKPVVIPPPPPAPKPADGPVVRAEPRAAGTIVFAEMDSELSSAATDMDEVEPMVLLQVAEVEEADDESEEEADEQADDEAEADAEEDSEEEADEESEDSVEDEDSVVEQIDSEENTVVPAEEDLAEEARLNDEGTAHIHTHTLPHTASAVCSLCRLLPRLLVYIP
jgi:hypothetical protein